MAYKNGMPSIAPLHYQYLLLPKGDIPERYKLFPITFKIEEIEKFEVLFFHRLMKKNYGEPSEIELEPDSIKTLEDGRVMAIGREWKYYVRTHSGGIIRVGTEDFHTRLKIYHVVPENLAEPSKKLIEEGEKFINDLLREAQRLKGQILNIKKEFESDDEEIKLYLLDNVFLTNYRSAELMLEYAEDNEEELQYEFLRFDARFQLNPEQEAHINKFMPALGMYYAASISYFLWH